MSDALTHMPTLHAPELLSPAGSWACARAAVENGADAIYFGLDRFNARMRADNFTLEDLPELMRFLHGRGVRGYLAFNTLVFTGELEDAALFLKRAIEAGVDAAIVQDAGLCRLIRRISPDFPIHASTQMTVTSAAGVEMARELGASLVVLARECAVGEIAKIRAELGERALPIEAFVHGALCVAYSGQCLTSEALGGRSANRGECAQACRLPYELVADGQTVPLGRKRYLLSPQDLAGLELVPELLRAGVVSFKIEGRLKTPEYVASITRIYREALDAALSAQTPEAADERAAQLRKAHAYELEMAFSRGLYTGWMRGTDNRALVHAEYPKKRGVRLGTVREIRGARVCVSGCEAPIEQGDGVLFDLGLPEAEESGGFVTDVERRGGEVWLTFHYPSLRWGGVRVGALVWKTSDPALEKRLRASFADGQTHFQRPVKMRVEGVLGQPMRLIVNDGQGHEAVEASTMSLDASRNTGLDSERLTAQLSRLGGSPFRMEALDNALDAGLMLPVSELNRMRRAVVERLATMCETGPRWTVNDAAPDVKISRVAPPLFRDAPLIVPMVRDLAQLDAVLPLAKGDIYAEFENHLHYRKAMDKVRAYRAEKGAEGPLFWAAPPRVFKQGEDWILRIMAEAEPDGWLVRNAEHIRAFAGKRQRGDYSLNVANPLAAEFFIREKGLEGLTASCDLNVEQLTDLLSSAPADWFEVTLHQHMPMFHMEHCVFCAFLSEGHDFRDCGRPCEKRRVYLRDRTGAEHYLRADAGCRNTLFNARAQTGADYARHFASLGLSRFRVEFLEESSEDIIRIIDRYERLLAGELEGADIWREFKLLSQLGVTRGTLRSGRRSGCV